jgi:hypothetical protein
MTKGQRHGGHFGLPTKKVNEKCSVNIHQRGCDDVMFKPREARDIPRDLNGAEEKVFKSRLLPLVINLAQPSSSFTNVNPTHAHWKINCLCTCVLTEVEMFNLRVIFKCELGFNLSRGV